MKTPLGAIQKNECKCAILNLPNLSECGCKGAVIKYGIEGGRRDLTGSAKLFDGKCWASKIFQVISMGHEGICLQYFTDLLFIVLKTFSIICSPLLIMGIGLHLNSSTVLSSSSSLLAGNSAFRSSEQRVAVLQNHSPKKTVNFSNTIRSIENR